MVELKEVITRKQLKQFINFPVKLYRGNPYYVPNLFIDEWANLSKDKNPAFEYCEARYFLAYKDGKFAGRIAAILSKKANEIWHTNRMRFSRMDFIDDAEVVDALFEAVEAWAIEKKCDELQGPIGFSDLDQQGLLINGFDQKSMMLEVYSHAYYQEHMERLGFKKDADWIEFRIQVPKEPNEKIERMSQMILSRNQFRIYKFSSKKALKPLIKDVFELYNHTYDVLYGTVMLTQKQIDFYVAQYINFVQSDFLRIILDRQGAVVGCGLAMPSLSDALIQCRGKLFPLGILKICTWLKSKKNNILDLYMIAIKKELQGTGLSMVLLQEFSKEAIKRGMQFAETGPELETNFNVQSLWKLYHIEQNKRRRCFVRRINPEELFVNERTDPSNDIL